MRFFAVFMSLVLFQMNCALADQADQGIAVGFVTSVKTTTENNNEFFIVGVDVIHKYYLIHETCFDEQLVFTAPMVFTASKGKVKVAATESVKGQQVEAKEKFQTSEVEVDPPFKGPFSFSKSALVVIVYAEGEKNVVQELWVGEDKRVLQRIEEEQGRTATVSAEVMRQDNLFRTALHEDYELAMSHALFTDQFVFMAWQYPDPVAWDPLWKKIPKEHHHLWAYGYHDFKGDRAWKDGLSFMKDIRKKIAKQ